MPGIPHPKVLHLRRLLKDFPVSIRRHSRAKYWNAFLRVERLDKEPFGEELASRLEQVVEIDACAASTLRIFRASQIKP